MNWELKFQDKTTARYSSLDWAEAKVQYGPKAAATSEFMYRCRAWSLYTGKIVIDWEWVDNDPT